MKTYVFSDIIVMIKLDSEMEFEELQEQPN